MDIKSYYERQISLSEWFENSGYKSTTEFRVEDNEKRERLRYLKKEIGVPFDEPVQFNAIDLVNNTKKFEKYYQKHSEEYCALRLIPKDPELPKLRMRGLIIRKAYDWFKEQEISPSLRKTLMVYNLYRQQKRNFRRNYSRNAQPTDTRAF